MKLHQTIRKIKEGFSKGPIPDHQTGTFKGQELQEVSTPGAVLADSHTDNILSDISVRLYDRTGRPHEHRIPEGNICLIGDSQEAMDEFQKFLTDQLDRQRADFSIVSAKKFVKEQARNNDSRFLIRSHSGIPAAINSLILRHSRMIFVFNLKGLIMLCPLYNLILADYLTRNILESLDSNINPSLRAAMISSLKEDEFLLIKEEEETVRRFREI